MLENEFWLFFLLSHSQGEIAAGLHHTQMYLGAGLVNHSLQIP